MTILVENPTEEGLAIRAANNILKWYFNRKIKIKCKTKIYSKALY